MAKAKSKTPAKAAAKTATKATTKTAKVAKAVKAAPKKAAPKAKAAAPKAAAKKPAKTAAKGKTTSAFARPLELSPELSAVLGNKPLPRTEVTKGLWAYIKKHGLQDPKNKRNINADDKLKAVFGQPSVDMFQMTKLVSKHLK